LVTLALPAAAEVEGGGSTVATSTTSTTWATTHTRVDLAPVTSLQTRVVALLDGVTLLDATTGDSPDSAAAPALVGLANAALSAAGAVPVPPQVTSTESVSAEALVGQVPRGSEASVTSTTTFGPATILIGEGQTVPYFVPAGTVNVNTTPTSRTSSTTSSR
jgi:hypothetical protein